MQNPFVTCLRLVCLVLAGLMAVAAVPRAAGAEPRILLDTDFRTDVDDPGTLAMIHGLQDRGEATLIGVIASTAGPGVVAAIDAVNTYHGRPDVPIGLIDAARASGGDDPYAPTLADTRRYPSDQTNASAPNATALYRRLLHDAPDGGVTIVVVGGQNAVCDLMRSGADHGGDGIGLSGKALIERKVAELVVMGGHFGDRGYVESNIRRGIAAARAVAAEWPTRIVYAGWEVGAGVKTGGALADPATNPVAKAYELFRGSGGEGNIGDRDSWDQVAALYAAVGLAWEGERLWSLSEPHAIRFTEGGRTRWEPAAESDRYFMVQEMPDERLASIISGLMTGADRPAAPARARGDLSMKTQQHLARGTAEAPLRGAYEVALEAAPGFADGFLENDLRVTFTRADGTSVTVDGFYDGGRTFKARAYLDSPGAWAWRSASANPGLDGKEGRFTVVEGGELPGKLRTSEQDPYQFMLDDGRWFLHIGDTGYRYLNSAEPRWRAYLDQAAAAGFTKVRTWFGNPGGGSNGNIDYLFEGGSLNLAELQTADRRLLAALNSYPHIQMQVIPFGEDDERLLSYADEGAADHALVRAYAREAHARYGALPNVHWALSNDRKLAENRTLRDAVDTLATDWAAAEGWGTLLTNHQARFETYSFVDAPWSDIVTFENLDQVAGERILHYRDLGAQAPIVNDEDRYESYRSPEHDRYFFRRMMWASLLSGGAATYGGGETWKVYREGTLQGVQGYEDLKAAGLLDGGADDFVHIHRFFDDTGLDLIGLTPDDALVGGDPLRCKAIRGEGVLIVYLANPSGTKPETDDVAASTPSVTVGDGIDVDGWTGAWFDPRSGNWTEFDGPAGTDRTFTAPGGGDWVLLLRRSPM